MAIKNPFPPGPWVRTVSFFANQEREWQNVDWWITTGSTTSGFDINLMAAAYDTAFSAHFVHCLSDSANYLGVNCYYNNTTYTISGETLVTVAGTASGGPLPSEDAVVVRKQANFAGPGGRGRNFFGGVDLSFVTGSRLNNAGETAYATITAAINAGWSYGGLSMKSSIWSRKTVALLPTIAVQAEAILGHRTKRRPIR